MRLIIVIPATNEDSSIGDVLSHIPQSLPGISDIRTIVVDDGSTDSTVSAAHSFGATVISHPERLGLASAFRTGLKAALRRKADFIATIDADGQYRPEELTILLQEMQRTHADMVVGNRCILSCDHMPAGNRIGNLIGSLMLRMMGVTKICDASSGFRLFNARLGESLRIMSRHTYTHEMLIQADAYGFNVVDTPVSFRPRAHGKSKLVRTLRHHILRSCGTIIRATFLYRPLRKFLLLSAACMVLGGLITIYALRDFTFHFSSMMLAILFAVAGIQFLILGVIAESYAADRRLMHEHDTAFLEHA